MSQIASTQTFDIKRDSKTKSSLVKKDKDDSFQKELIKKEKKPSFNEQLSAHASVAVEQRDTVPANENSSNAGPAKIEANVNLMADVELLAGLENLVEQTPILAKIPEQMTVDTTAEVAPHLLNQVEVPQPDVAELTAAVQADLSALSMDVEEGLSMEGMTAVEPQVVPLEIPESLDKVETAFSNDSVETLLTEEKSPTTSFEFSSSQKDNEQELPAENFSETELATAHGAGKPSVSPTTFDHAIKNVQVGETQATKEAAMDQVVQSARTLLKDGGGEMQLNLNPHGLGEVKLKVGVQAGEVNIEILAKDHHVKKLFEDGMADIRSALEIQNLKMDNYKVEVSHRAEQNVNDQQQDTLNREFARDFMNQFRGERQAMRQQNLNYDLEKSPDFSKSPEGLRPAGMNPTNLNGRLNIVA